MDISMRSVIRIAVALGIVAVLIAARFVYQGYLRSFETERALYAASLTMQLLDEYVATHDGAWPRSWNDLEGLPSREWGEYQWPVHSQEIQRYVVVDFAVNSKDLAEQKTRVIDAVQVIGINLSMHEHEALRDVLRVMHENMAK